MRRVVVTGIGIVSSIGNNKQEVENSLRSGRSGIEYCPEYAELGFRSHIHGAVRVGDAEPALEQILDGIVGIVCARCRATAHGQVELIRVELFAKLVEQAGFAHTGLGYDRGSLASSLLTPFKTIQQKFQFPFSSNKWSQTQLGADIKSRPSGTGSQNPVYLNKFFLPLDLTLT